MITGGSFRNEKFILAAESDNDAEMIKRGLCGKSEMMAIAPYGNKVNVSLQGNTILLFKKQSGRPLTYEEAHTLIKKIRLFDKVGDKIVTHLQREARVQLDAPLTLFFPSPAQPVIQVAFSYNWVSFETERNDFAQALPRIHDAIALAKFPALLKIFSNGSDTISIHNYDMNGIYIPRRALDTLADALIENRLIRPADKNLFAVRTAAVGVYTVSYMDARHLCQNVDETFNLNDEKNFNPLIGQQSFLTPILGTFKILAESGDFSRLSKEAITVLRSVLLSPDSMRQYALSETISFCIASFAKDFGEEISLAYKNTH